MRKINAGLFMSLDGVVESPDKWHFSYLNEEMGQEIQAQMDRTDAMLLGRKTYEEFASFWPNAGDDVKFADHMNGIQKYVVSSTLDTPEWKNSTVITTDEVAALKAQPGRDIGMTGSGTLVLWLLENGLVDELTLLIHPVVVGHGKRLFDGDQHIRLELLSSKTFSTGVLVLTYGPANAS